LESRRGDAYNEEAFRYLLSIERKRSERSGRAFLLLLVDLKEQPGASLRIDPIVAGKLFSALWRCLRETDFVGWYREDRVAGAVLLTQLVDGPLMEVCGLVGQRVNAALSEGLPPDVMRRLRVNVCQLPPRLKS
jgi:hypothetical protein